MNARALLDSTSSASFVSERLVRSLCLPRQRHTTTISGVAGLTRNSLQSLTQFTISSRQTTHKFNIVVPRVTCDLPIHPVTFGSNWDHLNHLPLADPNFGCPGRIDVLLVLMSSLKHSYMAGGLVLLVLLSHLKPCLDGCLLAP